MLTCTLCAVLGARGCLAAAFGAAALGAALGTAAFTLPCTAQQQQAGYH